LRLWGHFEGDAQGYRKDIEDVPGRDPLPTYERTLRDAGLLDDAAVEQIRASAAARVEDAVTFAKESPAPDPAGARRYVFATGSSGGAA